MENIKFKEFDKVQIGDEARSEEFPEYGIGQVVWKGNFEEFLHSTWIHLIEDNLRFSIKEYDLMVVKSKGQNETLYSYRGASIGGVVIEEVIEEDVEINLVKRIENEINKTPTGDLRNLLCDINIVIQQRNQLLEACHKAKLMCSDIVMPTENELREMYSLLHKACTEID